MRNDKYDDIEKHFLNKMEEKQTNKHEPTQKNQPHYSFSLFNLNQKHDPSIEKSVNNDKMASNDIILPKESQEEILTHPTFFPPPKVMDMEIGQEDKLSTSDDRGDEKEEEYLIPDHSKEDLPDERNKVELSTPDYNEGIDPSMDDEFEKRISANENESVSIREEIFMMLNEELEEERTDGSSEDISMSKMTNHESISSEEYSNANEVGNFLQENENDNLHIPHHHEQICMFNDHYSSSLDLDNEGNQHSSFTHFLETIYCKKKPTSINNEKEDFVHSIGCLTSVLKKISTELELMNTSQDYVEEIEQDKPKLTDLKKHFENELTAENHTEEVNEIKSPECHSITVKIPVVLSTIRIEVTIFKNIDLPFPIEYIQTIHWSIHSLHTHIPSHSSVVFVKGILVAAIEYVNPGETSSVHSVKIPIEWNHTSHTRWKIPPKIPKSFHREYTFIAQSNQGMTTHNESHYSYCDSINHSLHDFKFISQQECLTQEEKATLKVQGCLTLCLHLTQEQFVQFNVNEEI
jgi:hypothetical protein